MIEKGTLQKDILKIIREVFENEGIAVKIETLDITASLKKIYGLDSIIFIKIILALETAYNFEFNESSLNIDNFENISSIIDTVYSSFNS